MLGEDLAATQGATSGLHLWFLPRSAAAQEELCKEFSSALSSQEQGIHSAIARPERARRYLLGRILLRRALGHHLGCPPDSVILAMAPSGKLLADQARAAGLDFSLSHTTLESVLAIAPARGLGIDIELLSRARTVHRIGTRCFSEPERVRMRHRPDEADDLALSLWTLKEAAVKATGSTIWRGLGEFSFDVRGETPVWLSPPPLSKPKDWLLALGRLGPYHRLAMALCLSEGRGRDLGLVTHVLGGGTLPHGELECIMLAGQ